MGKDWDQHVLEAEELASSEGFERLRDQIVRLARPGPDDLVVDAGAGTGLLTLALAPRVAKVWAIDISEAMLEHLAAKATAAELTNSRPPPPTRSACRSPTRRRPSSFPTTATTI
jgi:16S rRNA A1518/A1519 N6-dimethyltransferase RsmA/KsgA/DIM1 with predicted DNA glycosylase/AP lyase activity